MTVSFAVSREVSKRIADILVYTEAAGITQQSDRFHHHMNLTATHANGCPLDFEKLAGFDDFSLAHDIFGIDRHINRDTGKLENCFLPRCVA